MNYRGAVMMCVSRQCQEYSPLGAATKKATMWFLACECVSFLRENSE